MPKAIVNSDDLKRFAKELKQFNGELSTMKARIERSFNGLDWHDQEYKKFTDDFTHTMAVLKKFIDVAPDHIRLLEKKANIIDEYHS